MNVFKIITEPPPPTSIEHNQQKQPEVPSYLQTKPILYSASQYISDDDPVKDYKYPQNIEENSASQKSKTKPQISADLSKEATLKIDISKVNKQIKQSKKGAKDKKKTEDNKEESEQAEE